MNDQFRQSQLRLRGRERSWAKVPLLVLPGAGGIALAMHILTQVSIALSFVVLVSLGLFAWSLIYRSADSDNQRAMAVRVRSGIVAGTIATIAYDITRYGIVGATTWSFDPFHALQLFGQAFIGTEHQALPTYAVGALYHLFNGVGFGVAFALVIRRPSWLAGIIWGLGLEFAMALLYPSWMRIAQLNEFLTVSVIGHVVYGATLGTVTARLLQASGHTRTGPRPH